jgi:hypothetical protein
MGVGLPRCGRGQTWLRRKGLPASVLQASAFRCDVTVFRLNATPAGLGACISAEWGGTRVPNRGGS